MSLNSVNTNMGAMVALQSLNTTQQQLATTQKRISTGYRVADATDDGAAYAIAQGVRSTVGALTSANQQLGGMQGLLNVTQSSLNNISNTMASMRTLLVKLADANVQGNDRKKYAQQYADYTTNVKQFILDASYNGKTLIGNITGHTGTFGDAGVTQNEVGSQYTIKTFGGSVFYNAITNTALLSHTTSTALGSIAGLLGSAGTFMTQMDAISTKLNGIGSAINYVNNQVTYNNDKIDALNSGLGALIDADLAKESAQLTALQIRQQLGTQALSLANQAPQTLLSLFK
ncbi:MAG: flagellin [Rhodopila sp.]